VTNRVLRANVFEQLVPAHLGQADIADQNVRRRGTQMVERLPSGCRAGDSGAVVLEEFLDPQRLAIHDAHSMFTPARGKRAKCSGTSGVICNGEPRDLTHDCSGESRGYGGTRVRVWQAFDRLPESCARYSDLDEGSSEYRAIPSIA